MKDFDDIQNKHVPNRTFALGAVECMKLFVFCCFAQNFAQKVFIATVAIQLALLRKLSN